MWPFFFLVRTHHVKKLGSRGVMNEKKKLGNIAPSDAPSLQASMPLCNLSVSKIYELLTIRTWQGWLDIIFASKLHKTVTSALLVGSLSYWFAKECCHVGEAYQARN